MVWGIVLQRRIQKSRFNPTFETKISNKPAHPPIELGFPILESPEIEIAPETLFSCRCRFCIHESINKPPNHLNII
jgi:hypothetical protein